MKLLHLFLLAVALFGLMSLSVVATELTGVEVLHVTFDGDINDSSAQAHVVTPTGVDFVTGPDASFLAGEFVDPSDIAIVTATGHLNTNASANWTVSMWINWNGLASHLIKFFNDDTIQVRINSEAGFETQWRMGGEILTTVARQAQDQWMLIQHSYNENTDNLSLTTNCRLNASRIDTSFTAGVGNWDIGNTDIGGARELEGAMFDVRKWNEYLSADDCDLIYNGGNGTIDSLNALLSGGSTPPDVTQLTVTATDLHDGRSVSNFSVTVTNSTTTLTNNTLSGTVMFGGLINLTSYTVNFTSNDSGGYFNLTTDVSMLLGTTKVFSPFQSYVVFNAAQFYTDFAINGFNVSIPFTANSSASSVLVMFMNGTSVNAAVEASAAGQINASITITTTPLSNFTLVINFSDAQYNVTAFNAITNETITDGFTINVSPTNVSKELLFTTTIATANNIPMIRGYNFTIGMVFTGTNFESVTKDVVIAAASGNLTFFSRPIHSVFIEIFSETLNMLFSTTPEANETVFIDFIGPSTANFTTDNGTLFVSNLTTGDYELRYSAASFDKRSFFFSLPAGGSDEIDLFLLNKTLSTLVVVTITDENDNALNASILKVLRIFVDENGVFKTVEMGRANFNGDIPINVELNTQQYRFIVERFGDVIFSSAETEITGTELKIQIFISGPIFENLAGASNVLTTLTAVGNGSQTNFTFIFTDTANFVQNGCLRVDRLSVGGVVNLCEVCASSTAATLLCQINDTTGQVVAIGTINSSSNIEIIAHSIVRVLTAPDTQVGDLGLFLALMLMIAIPLTATVSIETAMVMGIVGMVVPIAMGIWVASIGAIAGLAGAALLVIYVTNRGK